MKRTLTETYIISPQDMIDRGAELDELMSGNYEKVSRELETLYFVTNRPLALYYFNILSDYLENVAVDGSPLVVLMRDAFNNRFSPSYLAMPYLHRNDFLIQKQCLGHMDSVVTVFSEEYGEPQTFLDGKKWFFNDFRMSMINDICLITFHFLLPILYQSPPPNNDADKQRYNTAKIILDQVFRFLCNHGDHFWRKAVSHMQYTIQSWKARPVVPPSILRGGELELDRLKKMSPHLSFPFKTFSTISNYSSSSSSSSSSSNSNVSAQISHLIGLLIS
jgi:hypothetical protein